MDKNNSVIREEGEDNRPTIRQIAKLADVSIATVDRVIHKRGKVKEETLNKIQKIIEDLDYKPNMFARNLVLDHHYKIAVVMPEKDQDGGYWRLPTMGIKQAADNLKHFHFSAEFFEYDKFSESSFLNTAKKALQEKYDGYLIAPIQMEAAEWLTDQIPDGVPFIFFDTRLPNTCCLSTIHQNSFQGGYVAGKLMDFLIQDRAMISIVRFLPRTLHIDERVQGFVEYMQRRKELHLEVIDIPEYSKKENVENICSKMIAEEKDLRGIFVTGAHTYEIAECLSKTKSNINIRLIGFDLVPDNIRYMREDTIDFLISQAPDLQGFTGVYSLYRHIMFHDQIEPEVTLPIEIITKENLDFYLNSRAAQKRRQSIVAIPQLA